MPIKVHADVRHLDQDEFGEIAYEVMDHVFAVHNEMGRFLDEDIYRNAVAARIGGDSQTEVLIEVAFEDFIKKYYIDLLVAGGAVFESVAGWSMPWPTEGPPGRTELGLQGHNDQQRGLVALRRSCKSVSPAQKS